MASFKESIAIVQSVGIITTYWCGYLINLSKQSQNGHSMSKYTGNGPAGNINIGRCKFCDYTSKVCIAKVNFQRMGMMVSVFYFNLSWIVFLWCWVFMCCLGCQPVDRGVTDQIVVYRHYRCHSSVTSVSDRRDYTVYHHHPLPSAQTHLWSINKNILLYLICITFKLYLLSFYIITCIYPAGRKFCWNLHFAS